MKPKYIRIGSLEGFRDFVYELGSNPSDILAATDIDESLWNSPDTLIPVTSYRQALNLAADTTNTPRFGLLFSQRQSFDKLGPVGYLVKCAPTLRIAIDRLVSFIRTHDTSLITHLTLDDNIVIWNHQLSGLSGDSIVQQTELAVGLALKFVRTVISDDWKFDTVMFEHKAPADKRLYERIFRCPVLFEQSLTGMEFSESELDRRLRTANSGLYRVLHTYLNQLDDAQGEDFVGDVSAVIRALIENEKPTLERTANKLGMNRSQLQRSLKQEGITFQALVETLRYDLARGYLGDTNMPLSTISSILGYAEPAVFSRAFRRKAGTTPREWRQEKQGRRALANSVS